MRLLVKVGGAPVEGADGRAALARAVAAARRAGHTVILVHGGGNQVRAVSRRLGLSDRYVDGLRVTDAATADVVLMVLGGLVNRQLVAALQDERIAAVGLCGADGHTFTVRRHLRVGQDLGYVGEVKHVARELIDTLLADGFVPVLATVAPLAPDEPGPADHFYNVNADQAAGPLAGALGADALLFLSDVPGVLDAAGARIPRLTPALGEALRRDGVLRGGMIPKVEAAAQAVAAAPGTLVKIAAADGEDAILRALDPGTGTTFAASDDPIAWTNT
jgi:acetylglutamate kinase